MLKRFFGLLQDFLIPAPETLAVEMVKNLAISLRSSYRGPAVVFLVLTALAPTRASAAAVCLFGILYVYLAIANQRRFESFIVAYDLGNADSTEVNSVHLNGLLQQHFYTVMAFAFLQAAVPWVTQAHSSMSLMLIMSMLLITVSFAQTFIQSSLPVIPVLAQSFVASSLAACWLYSKLPHSILMAIAAPALVLVSIRGALIMGRALHETVRTRIELDSAMMLLRRQTQDLQAALHANRVAEREKMRLFSTANHDLRQPISAASLFIGVLIGRLDKLSAESRKPLRETLDKIDSAVTAIDSIVGSISELTILEADRLSPRSYQTDLRTVVHEVVTQLADTAQAQNVAINVVLEPLPIETDPVLFSRLLRNLIDNSLKHAPNAPLDIYLDSSGGRSVLVLHDHGPGIPNADLNRVFDEYVQLDNPERDRSKGLGLGLAIVKRFAAALGIDLWLESPPQGGVKACIALHTLAIPPVKPVNPPTATGASRGMFVHTSVMVVEDDADVRLGLETLLTDWGCTVTCFASAEFATRFLQARADCPQLILLDNRLPDGEGIVIASEMRKLVPTTSIYLLTGDSGANIEERATALGLPILYKPISAGRLRQVLRELPARLTDTRIAAVDSN